jgi:hypothetical protein
MIEMVMDIVDVYRWGIFFNIDHCADKERHSFSAEENVKIENNLVYLKIMLTTLRKMTDKRYESSFIYTWFFVIMFLCSNSVARLRWVFFDRMNQTTIKNFDPIPMYVLMKS